MKLLPKRETFIYLGCILTGSVAGFVIVAYRATIEGLEGLRSGIFRKMGGISPGLLAWIAAAVILGAITALLVRRRPLISGSGIPQVKAFILRQLSFDWRRELPFKFVGGSLALGAGMSLGREGPSIQLGSLIGQAFDEAFGLADGGKYFITAGAAAGISAAFNAPLAGVLFCIEELHKSISPVMLTGTFIASFCSNAVMWLFFGSAPVFDIHLQNLLPLEQYLIAVPIVGAAAGIFGAGFNAGLLGLQRLSKRLMPRGMTLMTVSFAATALVVFAFPSIAGGGNSLVQKVWSSTVPLKVLALLFAGKFAFTLFCYASGAPGGIFLPTLALGALLGALCQGVLPEICAGGPYLANYILLGMTAFFVAVVRAPITGAILITEMAGSLGHFPAFMLASVFASLVADLLGSPPIYDSLLMGLLEGRKSRPSS